MASNTSTSQRTCTFTVSATGATTQTFTVTQTGAPGLSGSPPNPATFTGAETGTINVLNWTGWTLAVSGTADWITTSQPTATQVTYSVPARIGNVTLTFSGGSPSTTLTFNVSESSLGGACAASPTLSLSRSSMSFPPGGGTGQQDPTDYSAAITSNTSWTASCSNAGGEALTFYIGSAGTPGNCTTPLSGSGNQTVYVDLGYNHANPPNALSSTLNLTTAALRRRQPI